MATKIKHKKPKRKSSIKKSVRKPKIKWWGRSYVY